MGGAAASQSRGNRAGAVFIPVRRNAFWLSSGHGSGKGLYCKRLPQIKGSGRGKRQMVEFALRCGGKPDFSLYGPWAIFKYRNRLGVERKGKSGGRGFYTRSVCAF